MTAAGPLPTVRRHPFVGLLGGLVLGTAVALWSVLYGAVALGTWPPLVLPLAFAVAGGAWGRWGPVRGGGRTAPPAVPTYNERVQQALADNESAIEAGESEPRPFLPGIGPPAADDDIDWHRHQQDEPGSPGSDDRR